MGVLFHKMETENLIAAHIAGDENAFPAIVDLYLKSAYNFAYRLLGNPDDAADVSQEAFIKAWKNIRRFKCGTNFKTWLFTIVRNCAIDHMRKKKLPVFSDIVSDRNDSIDELISDPLPLPDIAYAITENKQTLNQALSTLPVIYQEVILLKYDEEMSFEEIARLTKVSADTIRSRHRRALNALRKIMSLDDTHRN